jgi:8-hydroxy-5-deazaflavin:NADPH oxidoreductase
MNGWDGPVTIIGGSGDLGYGLALRFGHAGVPVVIGSRDAGKAHDTAARLREQVAGQRFDGDENGVACEGSDAVVLCVPFASQAPTLKAVADHLSSGQLLIDATVPLATAVGGKPVRALGVWQGSAAQQAAELVPDGVRVVSALHTVAAAHLSDLDHALDEDVLVCGDRKADKADAIRLIEQIDGLRCVDCGRMGNARVLEQLTPLMIGINIRYKSRSGIRILGLPDAR